MNTEPPEENPYWSDGYAAGLEAALPEDEEFDRVFGEGYEAGQSDARQGIWK